MSVLVWIEQNEGATGVVASSWEALGAGQQVAEGLGLPLVAAVIGGQTTASADLALRYGADLVSPPGPPSPVDAPQCYAPFLSADLGTTRDNMRQSVLDVLGLIEGVKACGKTMCNTVCCCAPNAMRMPISVVRRVTLYDISPNRPIAATSRASRPNSV